MSKFIFILGNNPALSIVEIQAILPDAKMIEKNNQFLVLEHQNFDYEAIQRRLGGTIKIGRVLGDKIDEKKIIAEIASRKGASKINFGFSYYGAKPDNLGMRIKGELKAQGINSRLVVGREPILSSVIVRKNKCLEFLVLPKFFGVTAAVQDFEEYGERDFGRPAVDAQSGMLPPKLAKMMINLSQVKEDDLILDPFCGSGTILTEAAAMGFKNLVGSDVSAKAVADTEKNLNWVINKFKINDSPHARGGVARSAEGVGVKFKVFSSDAAKLSEKIKSVDAIITEPYLGPALRGNEREDTIAGISYEVKKVYLAAFGELVKILKIGGRIVAVFPEWHVGSKIKKLGADEAIEKLGLTRLDDGGLIYKREGQKVWREIRIYQKV